MVELFEEIFEEVGYEKDLEWWELYDSKDFEIVKERICKELGCSKEELEDREDFCGWESQMYWDM